MRPAAGKTRGRVGCGGFSLLEVLAAIVIFSAGAAVLFDWIGQTATRLRSVGTEQQKLFGQLAALEYAKSINPALRGTGEISIGTERVSWKALPVGPESSTRALSGAPGLYVVQLYRVELSVKPEQGDAWTQPLYLAGWRQTRRQSSNTPFGP